MDKQGQGTALRCVLCLGYNLSTCGHHLRHCQGSIRHEAERQPLLLEGRRGGCGRDSDKTVVYVGVV